MKACMICDEKFKGPRNSIMCANCLNAKIIIQRSARAMMDIHGVPPASGICVECMKHAATCRDHRYYSTPLIVDHVCSGCNNKRGAALDLFDLIKQHRGIKEIAQSITFKALPKNVAEVERKAILKALAVTHWNRTRAAKLLGITFRAMRYRLEKYGLDA